MRCRSERGIAAPMASAGGLRTVGDAAYMLQRVAIGGPAALRVTWTLGHSGDAAIVDMATTSGEPTAAPGALIEVRLTTIRYAARDTNLFEFRRLDGKPLPAYEPGAHVDVHLPS